MSKSKEQIIAQVNKNTQAIKSIKHDINALQHWYRCLEKANSKIKKEIDRLNEEIKKGYEKRNKE